jgi:hypothetical protein
MILSWFIAATSVAPDPVVMTREPYPPSYWNVSTQANCASSPLVISGYGASAPTGAKPKMNRDGQPVTGPEIDRLLADLSTVRAVYRFSVQCGRTGVITLRIYEGEAQRDDTVRFRAGLATIKGNRLEFYTGLEPADAETFWWR